jgi:hypothetical protein
MFKGSVTHCYSSGILDAASSWSIANAGGGIAGHVEPANPPAEISYCYSDCNVSARNQVGGIMGFANVNTGITVAYCIAWNPVVFSGAAPRSGRVCGYFKKNIANRCYANPNMTCTFPANASLPERTDQDNLNGATAVDWYNGLSTMNTSIAAAKDLSWDESIWDLNGEKPRLAWTLD